MRTKLNTTRRFCRRRHARCHAVIVLSLLVTLALSLTGCVFMEPTYQEMKGNIPPLREGMETIEEQVILDQDGVRVTAMALYISSNRDLYRLYLQVGNGTDYDIMVNIEDASINGIMVEDWFFLYTEAGRKAQGFARFELGASVHSSISIEDIIPEIYEIEFRISVRSDEINLDELILSDVISLKTSAYGGVQEYDDSGRVLFDDGEIRIIERALIAGVNKYSGGVVQVEFFVENLSDNDISLRCRNFSVNGYYPLEAIGLCDIVAGKRAYDYLFIDERQFEKFDEDILFIDEIEFSFRIWGYLGEDAVTYYETSYYDTDKVALTYDHISRYYQEPETEPSETEEPSGTRIEIIEGELQ